MRKSVLLIAILVLLGWSLLWGQSVEVQFIFTSDSHYGLTRQAFRGRTNVAAHVVNAALVEKLNGLASASFPADGGRRAGLPVGPIDFIVDAGDIANRAEQSPEVEIQTAAQSWAQFRLDYLKGLKLLDRNGRIAPLYVVPGNHDMSNAIGFFKPMTPAIDKSAMAEIYNLMMSPARPRTPATYDFAKDKVQISHDVGGIHFVYITLWPDTRTRDWLETDLKAVSAKTPVIIFAHASPDTESKHFTNPNGKHDINDVDGFENLLSDPLADSINGVHKVEAEPVTEQRALEAFLRRHPNVTAYFHGDNNWNQFYDWTGPDHTVSLHTFRVDSPMKGHFSATDETKLSFQIATIDIASRTLTVREVLWNAEPQRPNAPVSWGGSTTVALMPRPTPMP